MKGQQQLDGTAAQRAMDEGREMRMGKENNSEALVKANQSLRKHSSGGEDGVDSSEAEVKVSDDSPKMSALGVCTGNLSFYHAYKTLSKYLLNRIQFFSPLCPSTELLLGGRLSIWFCDAQSWMASPLCPPGLAE